MKVTWRWLRFNAVGVMGFAVQLAVLSLLVTVPGLHYLAATVLAVEAAVLHNFVWHEAWTWKDRPSSALTVRLQRLFRFHVSNGAASLAGNLILMKALVDHFQMPVIPANLAAVLICSLVNFLLSHHLVFRSGGITS